MKITVLTLFPETMESLLEYSIIGKAVEKCLLNINYVNIRNYSQNKHKKVDDYPYSGGPGMLLKADSLSEALDDMISIESKVIYMSPKGKLLNQEKVKELSKEENIVIISGHYEGIDQRVIDNYVDEEISIGDYILTGGELPALVLIDSIARLIPGVLGNEDSHQNETFEDNLLEHPQYTRPFNYKGDKVPEILLSGDHEKIKRWKRYKAIEATIKNRPDLIEDIEKIMKEYKELKEEFK
ncbi:MAG: tRNA (guanosine(37)-N1)-methyltransferase TrmD [Bacillota bacterium]|nr:tRNA (guanosine(37)-N1)-methyltransferase TrmD [Bacillota bacterium]